MGQLFKAASLPSSDELVFYFRKKTEAILFLPYSCFFNLSHRNIVLFSFIRFMPLFCFS